MHAPFRTFIQPARARPQLWRIVLGVALGTAVYLAVLGGILAVVTWAGAAGVARGMMQQGTFASRPLPTLVLLFSFAGMIAGVLAAARTLHRRGLASLFGPDPARAMADFAVTGLLVLAVYLPGLALWFLFFDSEPNLAPGRWLLLLPLTLVALLVQTLAEELVFRGYLMQQLAARFASPLVWLLLPALAFGAVHYDPASAGPNAWVVVSSAALFGMVAADLTVVSGSLGAAWGFHFVNNTIAIAVLSTKGTITGLALRLTPYHIGDGTLPGPLVTSDMILMVIAWFLARRYLKRRVAAR